jgi:hypothetical protein
MHVKTVQWLMSALEAEILLAVQELLHVQWDKKIL